MARSRWQVGRKRNSSRDEKTRRALESTVSLARQGMDKADPKKLIDRVDQLEKKQRLLSAEAARLREENRLLRRDVKFLGNVVLEVYQLLYQLLGKKPPDSRIHSGTDPS